MVNTDDRNNINPHPEESIPDGLPGYTLMIVVGSLLSITLILYVASKYMDTSGSAGNYRLFVVKIYEYTMYNNTMSCIPV